MDNRIKRKMFYEVLPQTSTNKTNWEKAIGYNVHFIFHEFEGDVKIIDCIQNQQVIIFEYEGNDYDLNYYSFMNCTLSKIFGYEYRDGKSERQLREKKKRKQSLQIKIGDILKDDTRDIKIIDECLKTRKNGIKENFQYYKFHCNICEYEDWRVKISLINNKCKCPNCKKVLSKENRKLNIEKYKNKKKIFLENLPRLEQGTHKGKINWEKSVGYMVHFIYNEFEGDIKILKYKVKEQELIIRYNDKEFEIKL